MNLYQIFLKKGVAYFDPKTKIHLDRRKNSKMITESFVEENDMSAIKRAVAQGVLKRVDIEHKVTADKEEEEAKAVKEEVTEETVEEDTVDKEEETEKKEEKPLQCQAETSSGKRCQNDAKYPEEEPKYCGVHKSKLEE